MLAALTLESLNPSVDARSPKVRRAASRPFNRSAEDDLRLAEYTPAERMIDVEEGRNHFGRRALLKAGGFVTASGALGSIWALVSRTGTGGAVRKRARWIKVVDRPTLGEKTAEYKRFSGNDMFALYRPLKIQREGAGSFEAEQASKAKRVAAWASEKKPGYSLPDIQLSEGAWTLEHSTKPGTGLLSWTRISVRTPAELGVLRHTASPEEMASMVKSAARLYGAGLVGIAPMNEAYVNLQAPREDEKEKDKDIVFEDVDVPAVTDARFVIPRKMKWVVAIAIPMDLDLLSRTPTSLGDAATAMGYSHSAFVVASLAEFIRGLGYQAIPCVNDTAQSVPFAVDAGIGELGRLNKLVTPEFGPAVRLCKVLTDLPMACDKPVDFGLVEFCKGCRKCAEACPSRALSFDDEPSFKTKGPWNNSGHRAWFEDSYKCLQYWQKVNSGCGICLASCPYTKGAQAWIHEAVKATASIAPAADGAFRIMDNAFGYGKQHNPEQWWRKDPPSGGRG
jgi:reductive dehalogenase